MLMWVHILLGVMMLILLRAMPLYTDDSNLTLALVLCGNLQDVVLELRHRDVLEHAIGAEWLEQKCVSIDPCTQMSSYTDQFGIKLPKLVPFISAEANLQGSIDTQSHVYNISWDVLRAAKNLYNATLFLGGTAVTAPPSTTSQVE